jgi:hypothetical protein
LKIQCGIRDFRNRALKVQRSILDFRKGKTSKFGKFSIKYI